VSPNEHGNSTSVVTLVTAYLFGPISSFSLVLQYLYMASHAGTCHAKESRELVVHFFFRERACLPYGYGQAAQGPKQHRRHTHTPAAIEWTRPEQYSITLPPPHHRYLGFRQSTLGDFLHCRGYPIDFLQRQTMIPSFLGST